MDFQTVVLVLLFLADIAYCFYLNQEIEEMWREIDWLRSETMEHTNQIKDIRFDERSKSWRKTV